MTTTTKVFIEDGAVGHEDDVFFLELLLEFANQLRKKLLRLTMNGIRQEDADGCFLSTRALHLSGARKTKLTQICLQLVTRRVFDIEDGLGDLFFEFVGGDALRLHNLVR